jgi:hypothetical protein
MKSDELPLDTRKIVDTVDLESSRSVVNPKAARSILESGRSRIGKANETVPPAFLLVREMTPEPNVYVAPSVD